MPDFGSSSTKSSGAYGGSGATLSQIRLREADWTALPGT